MFPILVILFICVPIIEIGLFIQVGGFIGMWPTITIVIITALAGASLVRSQGIQTLSTVQARLEKGELPAQQIVEGVLLATAGVFLLTPGFMTDAWGLILLIPSPRAVIAKQLIKRVKVTGSTSFSGGFYQDPFGRSEHDQQGDVYEGEYQKKADEDKRIEP